MFNTLCFGEKWIIFETSSYLLLNLFFYKTPLKPVQFTLQNSPQQINDRDTFLFFKKNCFIEVVLLMECKTCPCKVHTSVLGSFSNDNSNGEANRNSKMSSGFVKQNNNLHVLYVSCTFLCRHYTTTRWKCLIWCFMEDLNKRPRIIFISLSKLESSSQKINSGEIHLHWHFQRIGINATMFEKMQIHFQNDIFAVGRC